jgi:hypothetical protein
MMAWDIAPGCLGDAPCIVLCRKVLVKKIELLQSLNSRIDNSDNEESSI